MASKPNPYGRPDHHTRAARSAGYPARSIFKLEEIDQRCRLLKQGHRVLDLGAAPGSWSLYAAKQIGRSGHLLAIDLEPLTISLGPNATFEQGDALAVSNEIYEAHAPFDAVISDMAPRTSGTREADQARSYELVLGALEVAKAHGAPGSSFVAKIFMGPDFDDARAKIRPHYSEVRTLRPESVRKNSFEIFLVALGKR